LLGQAEPILTVGGRAVGDNTAIFVGIDVAKVRNAIAIAGERGGEQSPTPIEGLSATIRSFSSSDHRRLRPVSTTSSRSTCALCE
jgi:hypothetical protein